MTTTATDLAQLPLLRPAVFGDLALSNRIMLAPTTRCRADNPELAPTERHAAYYAQRAGAGLVVTEGTWISEEAIGYVHVPGCWSAAQLDGWRRVTTLVHAHGGRILLQLWHAGAVSHPDHHGGELPLGASAVAPDQQVFTPTGPKPAPVPRPMTPADLGRTIDAYRTAALNARAAGFDGVELPALGFSLLGQFLDPWLNRRTDGYGGDRASRRRLLLEVIAAVAGAWPGERRTGVRIGPWLAAGTDPDAAERLAEDCAELATVLNGHPLAYLHVRGPEVDAPDFSAFARYRERFEGPLIANLGFDGETGNAVIESGLADAVSYATHFIANPDLVTRLALGLALTPSDPATHYQGGARGYLDQGFADYA
ncbi:alkene reductase [Kitasatospora sp. NPDC006697]|uniref:alkene reductase n=1 Tax=Kitasatospora sp. NPDC006697 TaxID=3364020 RepID=UPI00369C7B67